MARRRFQHGYLFKSGKRQKVWVARWWEDRVMPDGSLKRVRKAERLALVSELSTRRQAETVLADRLRSLNHGNHSPQSLRKFSDFVRLDWKPVLFPTMKQSTRTSYDYQLEAHLLPAFGDLPLREITRERIQQLLNAKLAAGLGQETVRHTKFYLSKILGTAEDWGYIGENPVRKTKLPRRKHRKREKSVITPAQFQQLVQTLPEPSRSLVILLTVGGVRIGEALGLRWRNVDLGRKLVRIEERVYDGDFDDPKTGDSIRVLELAPAAVRVFEHYAGERKPEPDALVFATRNGTPLCRRNLARRQLKPACAHLGITGISWHSLRHSYVTAHDKVGTRLGVTQSLVGHSSSEITRQVYLHSHSNERRKAAEKVEKFFFGPKRTQISRTAKNGEVATT